MRRFFAIMAAVALMCLTMTACEFNFTTNYNYDDTGYLTGEVSVTDTINKIDIDWISGSVTIERYDGTEVKVKETATATLTEDYILRYRVEGSILHIRFCKPGIWKLGKLKKSLTVQVPTDAEIEQIGIKSVSANVVANGFELDFLNVESVSGDIKLDDVRVTRLMDIYTVSGKVNLTTDDNKKINMFSVSGNINLKSTGKLEDFTCKTVSGKVDINAYEAVACSLESVSGQIEFRLKVVTGEHRFESTSGDVKLWLDDGGSFVARTSTVSGDIECDFEYTKSGTTYTVGEGGASINVSTVSGDIDIKEF